MEMIDIWLAHGDGGEHGIGPVVAHCSTAAQAEQAAKGQAWYGGAGVVKAAKALRIDGQVWLLAHPTPIDLDKAQAHRDAQLREETLAALSPEQLRVLGIAPAAGVSPLTPRKAST